MVGPVLLLLHLVPILALEPEDWTGASRLLFEQRGRSDQSTVHPVKTDANGEFVSNSLSHHFKRGRHRRDLRPLESEEQVYYEVNYLGRALTFNLTANNQLVSNGYILERRNGGANTTEHRVFEGNSCHLLGTVSGAGLRGTAAISTCKGLRGFFSLPEEGHYFIEPLQDSPGGPEGTLEPHVIFPGAESGSRRRRRSLDSISPCGVPDLDRVRSESEREDWERTQQEERSRPRGRRSVSRERWVETMVVADSKLIEYHGGDNVESYIFTLMNMVAGIFHDASIGNAIHVILVHLILLQGEEKGLKIVHHADTTLSSFCAWQKNLNPQSDSHPAHHDVAVLVTRKDICAGKNAPCETLGLSHLSGMCQPHRSCNINEDSGLPVAFTIAHEMGHSFGIHHDGQGNDCELEGRHPFIMSRQLMYDSSPLTWSTCSKDYITRFLDRGWGFCLDDRPSKRDLSTPLAHLGLRYTTQHQCQLQYGPDATVCTEVDNVCQILWCSINGSCRSKLDSPIDGTRCGHEKWCISGECVIVGKLPETVNGGWGPWNSWSFCSRTCGAGVQSADRECNNPKPEFGGKYCTGERKRYRTCNTRKCVNESPTFREMQCSEFDTVPYQNMLHTWIPVSNPLNPCELHCRPVNEFFSEKMLETVSDGTPCFMNNNSRNVCVNGVCKEVGCDWGIDSNAVDDRCGVCLGDGNSCQMIYKTFDHQEGFGYMDVGVIPEGARDILVMESEEAGNFLALRRPETQDYFLNGNFIIQWNGEYEAGGTTFYYEREGNMENLTAPGPTREPVVLQLLFQERNPGLKYEYSVKKTRMTGNEILEPVYRWRHGAWTDCSTTCGMGEQHQPTRCFEVDVGVVDVYLCDPDTRPLERHRKCKNMDCPARWWVGGWQQCSTTCGSDGTRQRTVLCVRTVSGEERVLHPMECKHLLKPKPVVPCSRDVPCGKEWQVGPWGECPLTCGGSVRSRLVTCALGPNQPCDPATKPRSRSLCALKTCPNSSLRRRPGPPPKYRRVFPPRKNPTKFLVPSTTPAFDYTTPFVSTTSVPEVTEDFSVVTEQHPPEKEEDETEEGSTPEEDPFVPGDKTEDGIIDLDATTTADRKSTTMATPTLQTTPTYLRTTSILRRTTRTRFKIPRVTMTTPRVTMTTPRVTMTTPRITTTTPRVTTTTPKVTTTTPRVTTTTPRATTTTLATTRKSVATVWPQTTVQVVKLKKPNKKASPSKKPKVNRAKNQPSHAPDSSSASEQGDVTDRPVAIAEVFWDVGNWSECSTTCGIGAMWRSVACSSQDPEACAGLKKPDPARTCLLLPCAIWQTGSWTRCPDDCALTGRRHREVQCVDTQSKRPLRPFHCQAVSSRPLGTLSCPHRLCLAWGSSPWGPCSGICGEGVMERLVYCPETHSCSSTLKPNSTQTCSLQPCTCWRSHDWQECSLSCGGGRQQREVSCVSELDSTEMPNHLCQNVSKPECVRKCNVDECPSKPACKRDTMSSRFCEKLKLLGRCSFRSVQKQCCATCRS